MRDTLPRLLFVGVVVLVVCAPARAVLAEKSNQIRPTPSPLTTTGIEPDSLLLTPRLVLTRYADELTIEGLPGHTQSYAITSIGAGVQAQLGVADWLALEVGVEGYQKLGSITGPSPGDPTRLAEADITGNAVKLSVQGHVRVLNLADPAAVAADPGDVALYVFFRGIGDAFVQEQVDPLFRTDFAEYAFEYRAGGAAQVHVGAGLYLVGFGGVDGVWFTGTKTDTRKGDVAKETALSGAEDPFPFVGGDVLWSRAPNGRSVHDAVSLGAILAFTPEDPLSGFGGPQWTIDLSYTLRIKVD